MSCLHAVVLMDGLPPAVPTFADQRCVRRMPGAIINERPRRAGAVGALALRGGVLGARRPPEGEAVLGGVDLDGIPGTESPGEDLPGEPVLKARLDGAL